MQCCPRSRLEGVWGKGDIAPLIREFNHSQVQEIGTTGCLYSSFFRLLNTVSLSDRKLFIHEKLKMPEVNIQYLCVCVLCVCHKERGKEKT